MHCSAPAVALDFWKPDGQEMSSNFPESACDQLPGILGQKLQKPCFGVGSSPEHTPGGVDRKAHVPSGQTAPGGHSVQVVPDL